MPTNISSGGLAQPAQSYYSDVNNYGNYQYITLDAVINNFEATYVGAGKIFENVLSSDISFHAYRALQELNYDTLRSEKSIEIEVCPSLKVPLPNDYVNYVKLTSVDASGIEHIIYPTRNTSNPFAVEQTEGGCTDCGDTSDTYNTGAGGALTEQEIVCGTEDINCTLQSTGLEDATHLNLDTLQAYIIDTGWIASEKKDYVRKWMGLIDGYCLCLKNSNSTDNCGELFTYADSWSNFFKHPTTGASLAPGTMDMELALLHWAGWSRFRTSAAFRNLAITGTLPSIDTNRDTSSPTSNTWDNFKSGGLSNAGSAHLHGDTSHRHYDEHSHGHDGNRFNTRYGLDPERAQVNGSYYIDNASGMIHFGSVFSGKTIIIKYISDGLGAVVDDGSDSERFIVPKLAEEAIYKWIAYGCASARIDIPAGIVQRLKQEKIAETRKAKLRLSNIKIEEITQVMRGKSKWIKH